MPLSTRRSIQLIVALVVALAPLATSADDESSRTLATDFPASLQPLRYPALSLTRDPFLAPPSLRLDAAPTEAIAGIGPGFILPPNLAASADGGPTVVPIGVSLRAVVVGNIPKALVQIGTRTLLVGIGSRVAGSIVVEIDAKSVRLSDGTRLVLGASGR
jgi:hypothetical protein